MYFQRAKIFSILFDFVFLLSSAKADIAVVDSYETKTLPHICMS